MDGIGAEGLFNIRQNQPWIHRGIECIAQSVNDGLLVYMAQGRDIRVMRGCHLDRMSNGELFELALGLYVPFGLMSFAQAQQD